MRHELTPTSPAAIRSPLLGISLCVLLSESVVCAGQPVQPDREAIVDRLRRLQNITARLEYTRTYTPNVTAVPPGVAAKLIHGAWGYRLTFRFLDGRAYYDEEMDERTEAANLRKGGPSHVKRFVRAYSHERAEQLTQRVNQPAIGGGLMDSSRLPVHTCIELALGLRCCQQRGWLEPGMLTPMQTRRTQDHQVIATLPDPNVNGIMHEWVLDPKRAFAVVSYTVTQNGFMFFELICNDFRPIDDMLLPYQVTTRWLSRGQNQQAVLTELQELRITEYVLNDPANTPDSFRISFPQGSYVTDRRLGVTVKVPTTRAVTDQEIFERVVRRQAAWAVVDANAPSAVFWYAGGLAAVVGLGAVVWLRQHPREGERVGA